MNLIESDKEFKEYVGNFILTFSAVEFKIGTIADFIKNGKKSDSLDPEIIGLDLNDKLKIVRERIKSNEELFKKWEKLEGHLSSCNDFRRFISHGILNNSIANPNITGVIRAKKNGKVGFRIKHINRIEVIKNLRKIIDVETGENGLGMLSLEIKGWVNS